MTPTDGLAQTATYHSAATAASETYNVELGNFAIDDATRGALWFDDETHSHWVAWMF
jgi:hypothetical protein